MCKCRYEYTNSRSDVHTSIVVSIKVVKLVVVLVRVLPSTPLPSSGSERKDGGSDGSRGPVEHSE